LAIRTGENNDNLSATIFGSPDGTTTLSKDYLAGTAQEEWIPLRPSDYYRDRRIEVSRTAYGEVFNT